MKSTEKRIGSHQAKTHLPRLLKRVAKGECFIITKYAKPIADLIPVRDPAEIKKAIEELREFGKNNSLGGLKIKDMINEGRR